MFQPGEEGYHGARHMIHEGVLDAAGSRVERAFGLHIYNESPVRCRPDAAGALMASADSFAIWSPARAATARRRTGRSTRARGGRDRPVRCQTIITRRVSVFEPPSSR